ncbi:hypothetical protein [Alcaligenes endophyticus]|uniref:Uncharacterized protein n=1 Tax=Alcaligenes endophyticus TaxID=1929088 RepID=A0ABT8EK74_9BURK|nr:hypothetical protein [Alcaligenes endophyticus]MCX5592013.1 hypothetical protein [Alcaligenes endophyticus]MDN4121703.1 hypothetical protein [Alcaligenes endophyticus]
MKIHFESQRRDDSLDLSRQGDKLIINGQTFDFSVIPDGATLPASAVDCEFIAGDIERIDGVLHITLLLPHGPDASQAACFPQTIINPADGPVELPV